MRFSGRISRRKGYWQVAALSVAALLSANQAAHATLYHWIGTDGTNPTLWDESTTPNWSLTLGGGATVFATSPSGSPGPGFGQFDPTIPASGQSINVSGIINLNGFQFDSGGWTFNGTGTFQNASSVGGNMTMTTGNVSPITFNVIVSQSANGTTNPIKRGAGTIVFAAANSYAGPTVVAGTTTLPGGLLQWNQTGSSAFSSLTIRHYGTAQFDSRADNNQFNRTDTGANGLVIINTGGHLVLNGNNASDTLDAFGTWASEGNPLRGNGTVTINAGVNHTTVAQFKGLTATSTRSSFLVEGQNIGAAAGSAPAGQGVAQLKFLTAPVLIGGATGITGIIPMMAVRDTASGQANIATYDSDGLRGLSTAASHPNDLVVNTFTAASNVLVNASQAQDTDAAINSLTLRSAGTGVTLSGLGEITVGNGTSSNAILSDGDTPNPISAAKLTSTGSDGVIFHTFADLNVSSPIKATNLIKAGPGTLVLSGDNVAGNGTGIATSGQVIITSGTLSVGADNNLGPTATVIGMSGGTLRITDNATITHTINLNQVDPTYNVIQVSAGKTATFSGPITLNVNSAGVTFAGPGTAILGTTNTYTGGTYITGGEVSISALGNLGTASVFLRGGVLQVTGTTLTTVDARLNAASQANFNGGFDIADPANTFTVGVGLNGAGSMSKLGAGVLKLTAAGGSGYSGGTTVSAGTLLVSNTSNSATGTGSVTMNGGTLGGAGSISGTVLAGGSQHTIAPSATLASTAATTLTVGGLTTNDATTLAFNLVAPNTAGGSDKIVVTSSGGLTLGGGTKVAITGNPTGPGSLGYYQAIQYNGALNGSVGSITMPAVSANKIVYTLDVAHDAGFVDIHRGFQGDANDDGLVNFADFVRVSNNYGLPSMGWFGGDFNGDGVTNFADFVVLSNNYGNTVGGSAITVSPDEWAALGAFAAAGAPVPEPASLALLGVGAAALLTKRRRK